MAKLTADVLQGAVQPRFGEVRIRQRGRLPHWEKDAGLYFLTFHLADSLPLPVLKKIAERHRILIAAKHVGAHLSPTDEVLIAEFSAAKLEEYLDRGSGACFLRDPRIGKLVVDALRFWQGKRYRLVAWCVMPNHVHVVCRLLTGQELSNVLRGWKSFTARRANEILGRNGAGKSTLLKLIIGEEQIDGGKILIDDVDISRVKKSDLPFLRRKIGMVFQDIKLLPRRTAFENIAFAMEAAGRNEEEIRSDVPHVLGRASPQMQLSPDMADLFRTGQCIGNGCQNCQPH